MELEVMREGTDTIGKLENLGCCVPGGFSNRAPEIEEDLD